jgi:hypothetical protein
MRRMTVPRLYLEKSLPVRACTKARILPNAASSPGSSTPGAFGERRARHGVVGGLGRILHEHEPTGFLDCLHADRTVAPASREHDGKAIAVLLGERSEKQVDGCATPPRLIEGRRRDRALGDAEPAIGWDHVDVIRFERHRVRHLLDGHAGAGGEDCRQHAPVLGREVHDDDEGDACVLG